MANFGIIQLTNAGVNAIVKAQAGNPLVFTKIKMGSGMNTGDVKTLTDLKEPQLTAEIVKGTPLDNAYTVEAHFTNEGLATGFYWREIGVYVKDSSGNDALFGYANAGTTADFIPATASEIYTKHVRVSIAVGDVQNITISNSKATYVDMVTFTESMNGKVDKVNGKGLSSNDFTNEEKKKLEGLKNYALPTATASALGGIKSGGDITVNADGTVSLPNHAETADLDAVVTDFDNKLTALENSLSKDINNVSNTLNTLKTNTIGNTNISAIGSTVTEAIVKLYQMISAIPTITSGTSEPSGGSDGDVYIMHE